MNLSNLVTSLIRTWSAILAGCLIAWAVRQGLPASDTLTGPVTEVIVFIAGAGYYLLVRFLEAKWPVLGWLLGKPTPPAYPVNLNVAQVRNLTAQVSGTGQFLPPGSGGTVAHDPEKPPEVKP